VAANGSSSRLTKAQLIKQLEALREENHTLKKFAKQPALPPPDDSLAAAHQLLVNAIDSFTDGFSLYGPDDRLIFCNETFRKAMDDVWDIFKPGILFEDFLRIRTERNQRKDGEVRNDAWIQQRLEQRRNPGAPLLRHFEDGTIIRIQDHRTQDGCTFTIRTDITNQQHATDALNQSETRFRTLIDNANQGIVVHRHHKPLYANPALARIYGYDSPAEILTLDSTSILVHPDFQTTSQNSRLAGDTKPRDAEFKGVRKNGEAFWLDRRSFVIDWDGEPAICSMRTDINARKEAEVSLRRAYEKMEEMVKARTRELHLSEARFRGAISNLQEGFVLFDSEDRIVMANEEYKQLNPTLVDLLVPGTPFEDLLRHSMEIGNPVFETGSENEFFQNRLEQHKNPVGPFIRERTDGSRVIIKESKTPDGGRALTASDITELKVTEELFSTVFNQNAIGIALRTIDPKGSRWLRANQKFCDMLGYTEEELQQLTSLNISVPEDRQIATDYNQRMLDGEIRSYSREKRYLRKDGEIVWTNIWLSAVVGQTGAPTQAISVIQDITELKKAEDELRASDDRFKAFIEHCPASISLKDKEGRFWFANKMWYAWHPNVTEDVVGTLDKDILLPANVVTAKQADRKVFKTRAVHERVLNLPLPDGTELLTLNQRFPVFNKDGEVDGLGTIRTDISERRNAEERLRLALAEANRANEAKSVFMATMSHELRTPLNAILGFSELMASEMLGPMGSQKYLGYTKDIHASSKHLLNLINDILDLAAIETGNQPLNIEPVDLFEMIADCSSTVAPHMESKDISYQTDLAINLPPLNADPRAIKQILLNVLTNAIKFTPAGGDITLTTQFSKASHFIVLNNTGPKIQSELLAHLTESFVRGETDPHRAHEGSGLGLAIVKSLIEAHDGTLQIDSDAKKGFTLSMIFPQS